MAISSPVRLRASSLGMISPKNNLTPITSAGKLARVSMVVRFHRSLWVELVVKYLPDSDYLNSGMPSEEAIG